MRTNWILAVLGTAFFVVILDSTIVFVALPSIQEQLGFSPDGVQWVLSAYLVAFGGLLLFGGRLADLLGRRRVLITGIALFTAASFACGAAPGPAALVCARLVQGVGAAILAPTALSLVLTTFEPGAARNRALGIWGAIGGVGGTAGLLLGGPITSAWGWSWVFFVNVPVGVVLMLGARALLPESRDLTLPRRFDVAGAVTVTAALVLLILAITEASWLAAVGSVLLLGVFCVVERRSAAPLVPGRVVRSRQLICGNVLLLVAGMCVDGTLFTLTLHAQQDLAMTPVEFGLSTAAMTGASVIGSFVGQAWVTRRGVRPVAVGGMLLLSLGSVLLARAPGPGAVGLPVLGAGLGAAFVGAQIAAVSGAPDRDTGLVAGIADTSFTIGGALGVAVLSTIPGTRGALLVAAGLALSGVAVATTLRRDSTPGADVPSSRLPVERAG